MFVELKTAKETIFVNLDLVVLARELPKGLQDGVEISYMSGKSTFMPHEQWALLKPHLLGDAPDLSQEIADLEGEVSGASTTIDKLEQSLEEAHKRIRELEVMLNPSGEGQWWYRADDGTARCRNCNSETPWDVCGVRTTSGKYPKAADPRPTTEVQVIPQVVVDEAIRRADMVVPGEAGMIRTSDDKQGGLPIPAGLVPAFNELAKSGEAITGALVSKDPHAVARIVTRVKRSTFKSTTSNSHRPMWTLYSVTGSVNLFDHADPLRDHKKALEEAGYLGFFQTMKDGETTYWNQYPIMVSVTPSGKFWDLKGIEPRKPDAIPDEPTGSLNPDQVSVCQTAQRLLAMDDLVVFDCETTGMDDDDEVVEIAGILLDPQHPSPAFQMLIKPTNMKLLRRPGKKNRTAVDIHGIDEKMLADAPHMGHADVLNMLSEYMDKKTWAAFNIDFDERLLFQGLDAVGVNDGFPVGRKNFCIQAMMNRYLGHEYSSLDESCKALGIKRSTKHRAAADAEDALKVLKALAAKLTETSAQPDPF